MPINQDTIWYSDTDPDRIRLVVPGKVYSNPVLRHAFLTALSHLNVDDPCSTSWQDELKRLSGRVFPDVSASGSITFPVLNQTVLRKSRLQDLVWKSDRRLVNVPLDSALSHLEVRWLPVNVYQDEVPDDSETDRVNYALERKKLTDGLSSSFDGSKCHLMAQMHHESPQVYGLLTGIEDMNASDLKKLVSSIHDRLAGHREYWSAARTAPHTAYIEENAMGYAYKALQKRMDQLSSELGCAYSWNDRPNPRERHPHGVLLFDAYDNVMNRVPKDQQLSGPFVPKGTDILGACPTATISFASRDDDSGGISGIISGELLQSDRIKMLLRSAYGLGLFVDLPADRLSDNLSRLVPPATDDVVAQRVSDESMLTSHDPYDYRFSMRPQPDGCVIRISPVDETGVTGHEGKYLVQDLTDYNAASYESVLQGRQRYAKLLESGEWTEWQDV